MTQGSASPTRMTLEPRLSHSISALNVPAAAFSIPQSLEAQDAGVEGAHPWARRTQHPWEDPGDTPGPNREGAAPQLRLPSSSTAPPSAGCFLPLPDTGLPREQCERRRDPQRPEPQPPGGGGGLCSHCPRVRAVPSSGDGWAPPTSSTQPQGPALFGAQRLLSPQLPQLRVPSREGRRAVSASASPGTAPVPPTPRSPLRLWAPRAAAPHKADGQGRVLSARPKQPRGQCGPCPALLKARPSTSAPGKGH